MPAPKRFVRQIKVNLTHVDLAFLEFVSQRSERTMGDEFRAALTAYRESHPDMQGRAFDAFVEKQYLPKLDDSDDRSAANLQILAARQQPEIDSIGDSFMPTLETGRRRIRTTDSTFNDED
jgi:hypothetical protein